MDAFLENELHFLFLVNIVYFILFWKRILYKVKS